MVEPFCSFVTSLVLVAATSPLPWATPLVLTTSLVLLLLRFVVILLLGDFVKLGVRKSSCFCDVSLELRIEQ